MKSLLIEKMIRRLDSSNLQSTKLQTALDIQNHLTDVIQTETRLIVGNRISVNSSGGQVSVNLSSKGIPIEEYFPSLLDVSKSQGTVRVDISLFGGEQFIQNVFYNPKIGKILKRKGSSAYPVTRAFGPSISQLYGSRKREFSQEDQEILLENLQQYLHQGS